MTNPITCKDSTWLVSESRERTLSKEELQDLEGHIAECPYCKGASTQFAVLFKQLDHYLGNSRAEKDETG
ncbi:MAG: zf-HC2 domain-containing protein [Hyphomicrobium denitrificans]|jgi:hypothetical protein|uniref:Zinc-finger domain-containing protein n=1 Tax=Hyphomicrobium denitrificans (strain ATCC 51888 / DSM 1869 / NCIMB 11706 / TK 0415) TaxID=582899 RepID=D8JS85_HYPDA|nr:MULTISPECIES: zf-HC2 domain-containing protein [Hyphomicrobium]ADJ22344.1 conserved hypothetical protein [Hyphomicrobium denitrificans ATCC 51888]MBN9282262.1 zf-HC2 domain-containing protein [Hyphomicrobium denitrificans]